MTFNFNSSRFSFNSIQSWRFSSSSRNNTSTNRFNSNQRWNSNNDNNLSIRDLVSKFDYKPAKKKKEKVDLDAGYKLAHPHFYA